MTWRYGLLYFATVFAAGFILGTIRVLSLEPWLGARYAELLEMPIMLAVVYFSARYWVKRAQAQPNGEFFRHGLGGVGDALDAGADIGFGLAWFDGIGVFGHAGLGVRQRLCYVAVGVCFFAEMVVIEIDVRRPSVFVQNLTRPGAFSLWGFRSSLFDRLRKYH